MKNKVIIYTDSSYSNNKCSYAFKYHIPVVQPEQIFIYGWCMASTSMEGELIGVIKAMEYIKQYLVHLENVTYDINIDVECIVDFVFKKVFLRWNMYGWVGGTGKFRRSNIELWLRLMLLYQSFPKGTITFKKVKSKVNHGNHMVHKIAYFLTTKIPLTIDESYMVSDGNCKSILDGSVNPSTIRIEEFKIAEEEKPWKKKGLALRKNRNAHGKIHWLYSYNKETVNLPVEDILITEQEHLQCKRIDFNGMLDRLNNDEAILFPIAVRKIDGSDKYSLVMGATRLFSCKIIGVKNISCIITELDHNAFKAKHLIS